MLITNVSDLQPLVKSKKVTPSRAPFRLQPCGCGPRDRRGTPRVERARRIAVLVGQTDNAYRRSILWLYSNAMTARGMAPTIRIADNNEGQLSATEVSTRLLQGKDPPDALITSSSVFAEGALDAARWLGVDVPGGFMIATVSDGPIAEQARPSITALRLDTSAAARRLLDLLARRLHNGGAAAAPATMTLDLTVRESTLRVG